MKKAISMMVMVTYLFTASVCLAYKAECMQTDGKFTDCKVDVTEGTLSVAYGKKKWRSLDRTIPGEKITGLSGGEYARRRVGESIGSAVLLGPLFLFMLFSKKKRDNFGVEFMNDEGKKEAVLIQTKKKYGFALGQQLKTISGLDIVMQGEEQQKGEEKAVAADTTVEAQPEMASTAAGVMAVETEANEAAAAEIEIVKNTAVETEVVEGTQVQTQEAGEASTVMPPSNE